MFIEINRTYKVEVKEDWLEVKNNTLYNTKLKKREGLEGDIVSFEFPKDGKTIIFSGPIEGYSCGDKVKIRGIDKPFENVTNVRFDHMSTITDSNTMSLEEKELLMLEEEIK